MSRGDAHSARRCARPLLVVVLVALAATAAPGTQRTYADEIDSLAALLAVPARYAAHRPAFSLTTREFTFHGASREGAREDVETLWIIGDGDRVVGYVRKTNEVAEGIRLIGHGPATLSREPRFPTGRLHHDTELGPIFQTCKAYEDGRRTHLPRSASYEFQVDSAAVRLTRRHNEQVNTFVIRCDSVFGYMIEATYQVAPPATTVAVAKAMAPGTYQPWPHLARYDRTLFTPVEPGVYSGFNNSSVALAWADFNDRELVIRDGGFVAFICKSDSTGWAFTRTGGGPSVGAQVCEAHDVWHQSLRVPANRIIRQRLVGIPPEVIAHLRDNTTLNVPLASRFVQVRLDEDFEAWPLPPMTTERGILFDNEVISLRLDRAGGNRYLAYTKDLVSTSPQINLEPNATYRCSARLKGERATAWISGRTYEWSPVDAQRDSSWFAVYESRKITPADGWRDVSFDITTPAWDPFIDIRFHVKGATACLDDFSLKKISPSSAAPASP